MSVGLLWKRRLEERVPLQYLTNSAHWRDMVLAVQRGVLIPRPETELMIDIAKEAVKKHPSLASTTWVDLGTGSGALALGLAREVTKGAVKAVDLSPVAAATARFNVSRMGLVSRVQVFQGTWAGPLMPELQGRCGGVLSNPPYIATELLRGLQVEVSRSAAFVVPWNGNGWATILIWKQKGTFEQNIFVPSRVCEACQLPIAVDMNPG